jgi:chemotaxis protein CheD
MVGIKTNPFDQALQVIHLKPGEGHLSDKPEVVATILGSCVSIVMHNPRLHLTAICHSMLPQVPYPTKRGACSEKNGEMGNLRSKQPRSLAGDGKLLEYKYVNESFQHMYRWLMGHGVRNNEIEVKLFGGGDVLQLEAIETEMKDKRIGSKNLDCALRLVLEKHLLITAIDVGGEFGRKLYVATDTGEVLLKKMKRVERERYIKRFNCISQYRKR